MSTSLELLVLRRNMLTELAITRIGTAHTFRVRAPTQTVKAGGCAVRVQLDAATNPMPTKAKFVTALGSTGNDTLLRRR